MLYFLKNEGFNEWASPILKQNSQSMIVILAIVVVIFLVIAVVAGMKDEKETNKDDNIASDA